MEGSEDLCILVLAIGDGGIGAGNKNAREFYA